jgi:hypothetical protein
MIKTKYKHLILILLILALNLLLTGCRIRLSFPFLGFPKVYIEDGDANTELNNFDASIINPEFQSLPNGTIVKLIDESNAILTLNSFISKDGKEYEYLGSSYPCIDIHAPNLGINSADIVGVIFNGIDDKNSLDEIEEIPGKLLPLGSIFEINDIESGTLTVVIAGHNAILDTAEDSIIRDYFCVLLEQAETPIYQSNLPTQAMVYTDHEAIEKLLYIAPETEFAKSIRLKLMEKEEIEGIKIYTLTDEELEEILKNLED